MKKRTVLTVGMAAVLVASTASAQDATSAESAAAPPAVSASTSTPTEAVARSTVAAPSAAAPAVHYTLWRPPPYVAPEAHYDPADMTAVGVVFLVIGGVGGLSTPVVAGAIQANGENGTEALVGVGLGSLAFVLAGVGFVVAGETTTASSPAPEGKAPRSRGLEATVQVGLGSLGVSGTF